MLGSWRFTIYENHLTEESNILSVHLSALDELLSVVLTRKVRQLNPRFVPKERDCTSLTGSETDPGTFYLTQFTINMREKRGIFNNH